tara:strand:- start:164 stop:457 length:294 start_codon:yes stop_codon:yes gene_type:complete
VKRILLLLFLLPLLSNCSQYTAVIGPGITLAQTGSFAQASTALSKSIAINEVKKEYVANSLTAERICPTIHSAEINKIFFETIEEMDCYYDPLSILR